jgi:ABC-2 type transport system ATP-binding protein
MIKKDPFIQRGEMEQDTVELSIQTFDLTRKFGERAVVKKLNLSIRSGKIFGLLGPNGAGKTTTIKMLATLLEPTEGSATVAGFDIKKEPRGVRRRIGYVPQMISADGALTGRENLMLSAKLYRIPRAERSVRIDEALRFMGLQASALKLVKTYSGGMIRKLELAQAMLHNPSILFLDEPTIGLDPVARRAVWDRLKDLRERNKVTVLITTHDMEEADHLCDELAIFHEGTIVALGKPFDLKAAINPTATLEEVFAHYSGGGSIRDGGEYRGIRQTRSTVTRLG